MKKTFLVAGGDLRQIYAAEKLSEKFNVYITGFDKNIVIPDTLTYIDGHSLSDIRTDYLLLPMPVSADGSTLNTPYGSNSISLDRLSSSVSENGAVFGGKVDNSSRNIFKRAGFEIEDYLEREEFSVLNALPTAEGALQIALEETAATIYGSDVLILGFGRIAKVLSKLLCAMGAKVTVAARKYSDIAWASLNGCRAINLTELSLAVKNSDIIFNTVPKVILKKEILSETKNGCLIIDLASKPGGVDFNSASLSGVKVIWALGLPGKSAPISAGKIISDTVLNIMQERGLPYE